MARRPDDFSAKVKRECRERVANVCSDPTCRRSTLGPKRGQAGAVNTGQAAHIKAASPGGKRYDANMTSPERQSIDNAIWLCNSHAARIDNDELYYTVELLQEWKRNAEAAAAARQDHPVRTEQDVQDGMVTALTGRSAQNQPDKFSFTPVTEAIRRIHNVSSQSLESLDPRFLVITSHMQGRTQIELQARSEDVPFKLEISKDAQAEFAEKMRGLIDWGKNFDMTATGIRMTGSPLLDALHNPNGGKLTIGSSLAAQASITVAIQQDDLSLPIGIFNGPVRVGIKGLVAECSMAGGMLSLDVTFRKDAKLGEPPQFHWSLNLDAWVGQDIRSLPHLTALKTFAKGATSKHPIVISIEFNGQHIANGRIDEFSDDTYFQKVSALFRYIEDCISIAKLINTRIDFKDHEQGLGSDKLRDTNEIARIARKEWNFSADQIVWPLEMGLEVTGDFEMLLNHIESQTTVQELKLVRSEPVIFEAFGQSLTLPQHVTSFGPAKISFADPISKLPEDRKVRLRFEPLDGFRIKQEFMLDQ